MLVLICGLPNAGKTTYSLQYDNVVHVDEVVAQKRSLTDTLLDMIREADKESVDLCIEGVFPMANIRKMFRKEYSGKAKCIWLDTPYEECIKRENRGRAQLLIENCQKIFEPPTYDEGWDEIIIIGGDDNGNI